MQIELTAYGWEGEAWSGFYPEEIPTDWRLDYYCNEFTSLVVPADAWAVTSIDVADSWLATVPAGFQFYWELADDDGASRLLELAERQDTTDNHLGGWLIQSGIILEHEMFEALSDSLPGAVYGQRPVSTQQAEQLSAQGITLCWQDEMKLNCRGRWLRVLQISHPPDLRILRKTIEEQYIAGVELLLILVKPGPHVSQHMRELQTLINLLNS